MKHLRCWIAISGCLFMLLTFSASAQIGEQIRGAWKIKTGDQENIAVFQDGYCSFSEFDISAKKFINTKGGPYTIKDNILTVKLDFNADEGKDVGKTISSKVSLSAGKLVTVFNGVKQEWQQIDKGNDHLAGCWRINGRLQGDEMHPMEDGPRKTLKLLSSTRFQWFAINTATGGFFGTGGGTYTNENGKYTEHIEFFSRDGSKVGNKLSFDERVEGDIWHHSGFSSTGTPIRETWIRYFSR